MVKIWSTTHTFEHPWHVVTMSNFRKYPNPESKQVVAVDHISRQSDPKTGAVSQSRLMTLQAAVPSFITTIFSVPKYGFGYEESFVDPSQREYVIRATSLSFSNIFQVQETCRYTQHPDNPEWAVFHQEFRVSGKVFGLKSAIEESTISAVQRNAQKGREVLERLCQQVKASTPVSQPGDQI